MPPHRFLLSHLAARILVPVVAVAVLGVLPAVAQPPASYYDTIDTSSTQRLRETLHEVIDDHQRFPYTSSATDTWDILEAADEDPADANRVLDVYRNASYEKRGGGAGNNEYNREHSWPKSYGFPKDGASNSPYTDCHHLFISDSRYNSSRNNKTYNACPACAEKPTLAHAGVGGSQGPYPGDSNWTAQDSWETWAARRGDVARALFYMDVRYEGGRHSVSGHGEPDLVLTDNLSLVETSGTNAELAHMGHLSTLVAWHRADPVDDRERHRNDVVAFYQGNRNPFIDHPEWADCLFAGDCSAVAPPRVLLAAAAPAPSGWVVPGPRVRRYVHVRRAPTTDSDIVERLRVGERARLVGASTPRWYEVELVDGTRGFVSKSWTRIETPLRARRLEELRIHVVNTGPGNCVFIQCPGEDTIPILADCGQHFKKETTTGRSAAEAAAYLAPLFAEHEAPPALVVSHPHQDHYSYVTTVLEGIDPMSIWLASTRQGYRNSHDDFDEWLFAQAAAGTPVHDDLPDHWFNGGDPIADETLSCGDAEVSVLTVNVPRKDGSDHPNANSLVLLLRYGDFTAILPGDAEDVTETSALANFPDVGDVSFLVAAHHGSYTHGSNGEDWAERISPQAVVYSAGWAFGHPHCDATDRYREDLATVTEHAFACDSSRNGAPGKTERAEYATEVSGPIVVTTDGGDFTVDCPESWGCGDAIAP